MTESTKQCINCDEIKPATKEHFHKEKSGFRGDCKICRQKKTKTYYESNKEAIAKKAKEHRKTNKEAIAKQKKAYYEANKEAITKQRKVYYEANKEKLAKQRKGWREANKEYIAKKHKGWREANKEYIAKKHKEWREANKECLAKKHKDYYEANKEAINLRSKQRGDSKKYYRTPRGKWALIRSNAKHRNLNFSLPFDLYESQLWGKPCHYCGCEIEVTGLDRKDNDKGYTPDNVVPSCWDCNSKKKTKPYEQYLAEVRDENNT